jgi:hypothetical protein
MNLREDEILARYLYRRKQFKPSTSEVRHQAFMPPADQRLSVGRTDGLSEQQVWDLGDSLGLPSPPIARGELGVVEVLETGLKVDPDNDPPRHASIVGWPSDESAILEKAVLLSRAARLQLRTGDTAT